MALMDYYRKLCPKSGHALSDDARAAWVAAGRARSMRCDACGRVVDVCLDPGTGRSLLYAMHLREGAGASRDRGRESA
jgi:hypothetical protein